MVVGYVSLETLFDKKQAHVIFIFIPSFLFSSPTYLTTNKDLSRLPGEKM